MRRINTLLLSNNYIFRIGEIGEYLPNLTTLVLTNNRIASLSEIDHLASLEKLELLSLMDNPLTENVHYRLYVIHKMPSLKSLDFRKVTRQERETAARLFASAEGKDVLSAVAVEGQQEKKRAANEAKPSINLTTAQREQIRRAIEAASTKEEVDRIETQLRVSTASYFFLHCAHSMLMCSLIIVW
jgi:U2 small nuclear ribonucleoprotein A'